MILDRIQQPADLRALGAAELNQLAEELRQEIIAAVAKNGGHLAPNLGVVELTLALHRVFESPRDKIIWDVGHQSYAHKMLTGRRRQFDALRRLDGLSGFPKREESEHDAFNTGHASTSISAALGMAKARDLAGEKYAVVAVIGDGAMTGGMAFEALDHAGHDGTDLIVVLNDNRMSIAPNVGAISNYLTRLRTGSAYNRVKGDLEDVMRRIPRIGPRVAEALERVKDAFKHLVVPGQLFEDLGFNYYGPIDGHDRELIESTLRSARQKGGPVLIHVITQKGRGYAYAEEAPDKFHGGGPFDVTTGKRPGGAAGPTYTDVFAEALIRLAERDPRIVAITAAMPDGTGLSKFARRFPDRCFDVGIAEQHAVTFAAGLACAGLRPVVAIYSTFLQRALDQIIHDVALQKLPVVFAIDRAGIVGDDGETHQGQFDLAYLRAIPGMTLMAPADEAELAQMLATAVQHESGPIALRYPRGKGPGAAVPPAPEPLSIGRAEVRRYGDDAVLLCYGAMVEQGEKAAELLAAEGLQAMVVNARFAKPLDVDLLDKLACGTAPIFTVEEHAALGGFGSAVLEYLATRASGAAGSGIALPPVRVLGLPDAPIPQGSIAEMRARYGLDAAGIAQVVVSACWAQRRKRDRGRERRERGGARS